MRKTKVGGSRHVINDDGHLRSDSIKLAENSETAVLSLRAVDDENSNVYRLESLGYDVPVIPNTVTHVLRNGDVSMRFKWSVYYFHVRNTRVQERWIVLERNHLCDRCQVDVTASTPQLDDEVVLSHIIGQTTNEVV